nr:hypothetical protein [uncultured Mucilaginibacter sp.]
MDRELKVTKEGLLFAEVKFSYQTQVSGRVEGIYYNSYWVIPPSIDPPGPGFQASVPLYVLTKRDVQHAEISSIEALKKFDVLFMSELEAYPPPGDDAVFEYQDFHRRYPVDSPLYGVVDVQANFGEDLKTIKFVSADRWNWDKEHAGSCLTADATMIAQMAEYRQAVQRNKIF